jgi:hypothetical protein
MIKKKIKNEEVAALSNATIYNFPKYTTMIVNLVNGTAQATRPKVVGQMSDLIQEFDGKTLDEWIEWYSAKMPNAINEATAKISALMVEIKKAMYLIDDELIENWVKDLVYTKTFCGLKVQQAIISYIAGIYGKEWRLADKREESKGIDGFIGETPIQIKADTYKQKGQLNEVIDVPIVYYEKKKDGLNIEFNPLDFEK